MPTIVGFGSLLSETSARSNFGSDLANFRLATVKGYRRVFMHPASIFFEQGIADLETKEIASLSTEKAQDCELIVSVFDIPDHRMSEFYEREEEFDFVNVTVEETTTAIMCTQWTDEGYINSKGVATFNAKYGKYGLKTIWHWDGTILPCRVYLRHCVLSVEKLGPEISSNFLTTTFLADRKTTIQEYLAQNPSILTTLPPPAVRARYSG